MTMKINTIKTDEKIFITNNLNISKPLLEGISGTLNVDDDDVDEKSKFFSSIFENVRKEMK